MSAVVAVMMLEVVVESAPGPTFLATCGQVWIELVVAGDEEGGKQEEEVVEGRGKARGDGQPAKPLGRPCPGAQQHP